MTQQYECRKDCKEFDPKEFEKQTGDCQTDGHYLCAGCRHIAPFDLMDSDNKMRYYPKQYKAWLELERRPLTWWAVTGTHHGSFVQAKSEGEARRMFHEAYNGESITHVKHKPHFDYIVDDDDYLPEPCDACTQPDSCRDNGCWQEFKRMHDCVMGY